MKKIKILKIVNGLIAGMAFLLFALLFGLTLTQRGLISMHGDDWMTFSQTGKTFKAAVLGSSALLLCVCFLGQKVLQKIAPKKLFCFLAAVFFLFGLYLVLGTNEAMFYDDKKVYDTMNSFRAGDYSAMLPGNYLFMFPFQISLILFEALLSGYNSRILFLYLTNLFLIIGIQFFQWKLSERVFLKRRDIINLSMVLSFSFLPLLFLTLWVYGDIPGLFFALGGCYFCLKSVQERKAFPMVLAAGMMAAACWLRMNYLIMAVALFMILLFEWIQIKKPRYIAFIGIFGLVFICGKVAMNQFVEQLSGIHPDGGIPTVLYVVMGLQDSREDGNNAGWWNSYSWSVYQNCDFDKTCALEKGLSDLRGRLNELVETPSVAGEFFWAKIKSTWCEPTFQSLWYGSLHIFSGPLKHGTSFLRSLRGEDGGSVYKGVVLFCGLLECVIFLFSAIRSYLNLKNFPSFFEVLPVLFFIGTFLFHLIWETKSRYALPAVYCVIPYAASGVVRLVDHSRTISIFRFR